MNELSDEDVKLVAGLLAKLKPGFLPPPIFHEITRLTATPIVEIVPLRSKDNAVQILLLQRGSDDPVWPNMLHIPGTVLRATDSLETAIDRVLTKELNEAQVSKPKFVTNILHHSGRGMEASQVYWVEVISSPIDGQFFDTDNLPDNLVKSQLDFIPQAIEDYRAQF